MICPACGFDNLQGADECENCGADLRAADIPGPSNAFEANLVNVPLAAVSHHAPLTIVPSASAADAVRQMQAANVGCLLVQDADGALRGILSERDLVLKLYRARLEGVTVADLMTSDPVVLRADDSVAVAIHKMAVGGFRHIPLVTDGHATGIVSARDIFAHILAALR
ncbi:MAG: CBS domain-containing protein [Chloroflexota bacterium]|nr:CBS domain-containing protein [Chloroflexota bacterium]